MHKVTHTKLNLFSRMIPILAAQELKFSVKSEKSNKFGTVNML